ncbi:MAG: glycine/D-amino acid oxidase-like deaminating enzyme [Granulosicoccus sp.]|jgi:glycine/D-amino acid oxidase-like deaminating enzyme
MTNHADQAVTQPASTGIVIIGGGVAGVSAALFLAEAGIATVLCEKGRIAGEQSSRNWGWIRKQGRAFEELPLMIESARLWERIASELDEDIGFRKGGSTYLASTEAELEERARWLETAKGFDVDSRLLDTKQTDKLLDQTDKRFAGALHTPSDAYAEPALAVPAIARLVKNKGGTILENTAVRALIREAGRVCGVVTEHGPIRADGVILAGGIWSRSLLENEGASFPQLAIRSSALRTKAAPLIASSTFGAPTASIRRRLDGGYTIGRSGAAAFDITPASLRHFGAFLPIVKKRWGILKLSLGQSFFGPMGYHRWNADQASPFEAVRTMDPTPDHRLLDEVMKSAQDFYPQLSQSRPAQSWAGMIDVMPDELCTVGELPELPGLVLATGMSGHGFGLGPAVGMLAAQVITGETPLIDPYGLSPIRFRNPVIYKSREVIAT